MNGQKLLMNTDGMHTKRLHKLWLGLFLVARVEGHSMIPTLYPDDLVLVVNMRGRISQGDVVLADVEGCSVIKHVRSLDTTTASCTLGDEQSFANIPRSKIKGRVIMVFSWYNGIVRIRGSGVSKEQYGVSIYK